MATYPWLLGHTQLAITWPYGSTCMRCMRISFRITVALLGQGLDLLPQLRIGAAGAVAHLAVALVTKASVDGWNLLARPWEI